MSVGRGMLTCSKQGNSFGKFCFCESPWSNEPRRFGQSLSLSNYHLPKCLSPFATIDLTQYKNSKVVLGKVGNQLIGLYAGEGAVTSGWASSDGTSGGETEDLTEGPLPLIDLESQQVSDFPNEAGAGPLKRNSDTVAVLENRVYGVADDHLVVVDSCLRSSKFMYACGSIYCLSLFGFLDFDLRLCWWKLRFSQLYTKDILAKKTRAIRNPALKFYRGIVAYERSVYLLPVTANSILIMDVNTENFTELPLPSEWHSTRKKFLAGTMSAGKLFACPHDEDFMLVLKLPTRKFSRVNMALTRGRESARWNGLTEFEGLLYLAPFRDPDLWVINASAEKVDQQISLSSVQQGCGFGGFGNFYNVRTFGPGYFGDKFIGAAVSGRTIVFAPFDASCILIFDVDRRGPAGLRYIPIEKTTNYVGVLAVGSKLYFFPMRPPILVLDLQDQEVSFNVTTVTE